MYCSLVLSDSVILEEDPHPVNFCPPCITQEYHPSTMTYISPERREKSGTVTVGKRKKFPVDSVQTATSALKELNHAKPPLSDAQRASVISEAHKYVPSKKAPPKKGAKKPGAPKKKNNK